MFGVTPGIYKNKGAVKAVIAGYEIEEQEKWIIVYKNCDTYSGFHTLYRPCRESDKVCAIDEGWTVLGE